MIQSLFPVIEQISFLIGLVGVLVITIGAAFAFGEYLMHHFIKEAQNKIFSTLSYHLVLGLDFLVGKDIIDTLLLSQQKNFWQNLAGLGTVVVIRITLTHFLQKDFQKIGKK